jgi:hypothetical protein
MYKKVYILAQPEYKMWIIQETNKFELWNKLHFEEEKSKSIYHVVTVRAGNEWDLQPV